MVGKKKYVCFGYAMNHVSRYALIIYFMYNNKLYVIYDYILFFDHCKVKHGNNMRAKAFHCSIQCCNASVWNRV